jgi:hypothetical protein
MAWNTRSENDRDLAGQTVVGRRFGGTAEVALARAPGGAGEGTDSPEETSRKSGGFPSVPALGSLPAPPALSGERYRCRVVGQAEAHSLEQGEGAPAGRDRRDQRGAGAGFGLSALNTIRRLDAKRASEKIALTI